MMNRMLLSMGTRPEIIKMLPVYFELKARGAEPILLHTGQHSDMAWSLYDLYGVKPDYSLNIDRTAITEDDCQLASLSSLLLQEISRTLQEIKPSAVLVHGDTSSALMAAMAAFYQQIPIAHVEAGLRSFNEYNPFPEEKNRVLIGKLAHWHFAPTQASKNNLRNDAVNDKDIYIVGNTIVEAAKMGLAKLDSYLKHFNNGAAELVAKLEVEKANRKMVLVTVHRRENQENGIRSVAQAVLELMERNDDLMFVWPVHPNPVIRAAIDAEIKKMPQDIAARLHITEPLDYPVLLWIMKHSWLVLSDSGGIQEESIALSTPVLVLRNTTERPELIEAGGGALIGTNKGNIIAQVENLRRDDQHYDAMCNATNPFGDGNTARKICDILIQDKAERHPYAL